MQFSLFLFVCKRDYQKIVYKFTKELLELAAVTSLMDISSNDTGWKAVIRERSELSVQWGTSLVADENLGLQRDRKAESFASGSRGSASL